MVHPAYWRRGHGERLVRWGLDAANVDGVSMGVLASGMGERLYSRLGFEQVGAFALADEDNADQKFEIKAFEYRLEGR